MRRTVSCCKDFPDRILYCHSTCEKYIAEIEQCHAEKAEVVKKHNMDSAITHAMIENKRRVKKAIRKK